jgi:hypothetical protein
MVACISCIYSPQFHCELHVWLCCCQVLQLQQYGNDFLTIPLCTRPRFWDVPTGKIFYSVSRSFPWSLCPLCFCLTSQYHQERQIRLFLTCFHVSNYSKRKLKKKNTFQFIIISLLLAYYFINERAEYLFTRTFLQTEPNFNWYTEEWFSVHDLVTWEMFACLTLLHGASYPEHWSNMFVLKVSLLTPECTVS